jgi:regulatory protein
VLSDGRELLFSGEAVERTALCEGQAVSDELLAAVDAAEQRVLAHEASLRLLAHRGRSEQEMRTRLAMRGFDPATIADELERLRAVGLLDDERFARAWVEDRRVSAPRGRRLIRYELLGRGIEPEAVDAVTEGLDDRTTALELARRKARSAPQDGYEAFLARVGGFLRRRGFDYEIAAEAARVAWLERSSAVEPAGGGQQAS